MMTPKHGDVIAVWFSCGAASAVAAKLTIEKYGHMCTIHVVNNPVLEERADNKRFLKDIEKWIGVRIQIAINRKFLTASAYEVWEQRQYMSGPKGAPCTNELKKKARQAWETDNPIDWMVMGFTSDELARHERFIKTERNNVLPILIEAGVSKKDCFTIIQDAGIVLPESYFLGYPNANCDGCVKASSATYWNHIRKVSPAVFASRAEQSRRLGARLVWYKGKRIFLDELPEDAVGRSMKTMQVECGIFCEEKLKHKSSKHIKVKQKILDILQDYFADKNMTAEIKAVLDNPNIVLSNAISILDNKQVTQAEIRDWATLHGYTLIKCTSMADRLKIEKVAREIWGEEGKGVTYFTE